MRSQVASFIPKRKREPVAVRTVVDLFVKRFTERVRFLSNSGGFSLLKIKVAR